MELPRLSTAVYQLIYCTAWASPCSGDSSVFSLGFPHLTSGPVYRSGNGVAGRLLRVSGVKGAPPYPCLFTCVPPFSLDVRQ